MKVGDKVKLKDTGEKGKISKDIGYKYNAGAGEELSHYEVKHDDGSTTNATSREIDPLNESLRKDKFEKFLESLKGNGQDTLIESVKKGFKVCMESSRGVHTNSPEWYSPDSDDDDYEEEKPKTSPITEFETVSPLSYDEDRNLLKQLVNDDPKFKVAIRNYIKEYGYDGKGLFTDLDISEIIITDIINVLYDDSYSIDTFKAMIVITLEDTEIYQFEMYDEGYYPSNTSLSKMQNAIYDEVEVKINDID